MTEEKPDKKPKPRRVGQVVARGNNKWLVRIFVGYKPNGQNDYFNKTFHGSKTEAEKWLRGALARRDRGEPLEDPDITFAALFEEWLGSKKRKANVLDPSEAAKVLDACRAEPSGIFAAFLLWAGTRPNEAAALQWKDVDWEKGSVEIRRNLVRLKGGGREFNEPKTEAGVRSFTLPASFMVWLKEHRTAQLEQRMRIGSDWGDNDLVFPDEVGEPITTARYHKIWHGVLERASLSEERKKMRPYDARHSVATLLLLQRTPTKVVSARLGHATTSITEDVYSHVLDSMQEQATDDLERAILGGAKQGKKG
jgi:integrase